MFKVAPQNLAAALAHRRDMQAANPQAFLYRPEGLESLALVLGSIGNPRGSRTLAELAVEDFPQRWTAWVRLAEACLALEDVPAAKKALDRARQLRPLDQRIARRLEALDE